MTRAGYLAVPLLSLFALLAGCAGPMPRPDPARAWVSLGEETPEVLMAERLDGQRLDDGRFFEVPPGAHSLQVQLYDNQDSNASQLCDATLKYDGFRAGDHYRLEETSLGREFSARL
ncbi:hypothetical protein, partial [Pseudomonas citronellolis]|uniref:PA0061/PA0062 family lipoprotein n=1 Tax=Pseudomonas citronellolis TaxID=53408 RepID=UPI0023E44ED8